MKDKPNIHYSFGAIMGTIRSWERRVIAPEKALNDIKYFVDKYDKEWSEYMKEVKGEKL